MQAQKPNGREGKRPRNAQNSDSQNSNKGKGASTSQRKRTRANVQVIDLLQEEPVFCAICYEEEGLNTALIHMQGCDHALCDTCAAQYMLTADLRGILHPTRNLPICPQCKTTHVPKKSGVVPMTGISRLQKARKLTTQQYDGIVRGIARASAGADADMFDCIKCKQPFLVEPKTDARVPYAVVCPYCKEDQCVSCQVPMKVHKNMTCAEFKRSKNTNANSQKEMERLGVRCPSCKTWVMVHMGCNKVSCPQCKSMLCNLCGKKIQGYQHFDQAGPCKHHLWTPREEWLRDFAPKPKKKTPGGGGGPLTNRRSRETRANSSGLPKTKACL
jgi:hypothetical protein